MSGCENGYTVSDLNIMRIFLVITEMFSGIVVTDFENLASGVRFTYKGYFIAANSHYIHTICRPALIKADGNGTLLPSINF